MLPGFFVHSVLAGMRAEGITQGTFGAHIPSALSARESGSFALPAEMLMVLLHRAGRALERPDIGLSIGACLSEGNLSLLGPLLVASPTMRTALDAVDVLSSQLAPGAGWQLHDAGGEVVYGPPPMPDKLGALELTDLMIAVAVRCARHFAGLQWAEDVQARFAFAEPHYGARYRAVLGESVRFGAPHSGVRLTRQLLDQRRPGADSATFGLIFAHALERLSGPSAHDDWTSRIEAALRAYDQLAQIDVARLAARWELTPRALARKLEAEGTRMRDVLDKVRFERARQLLSRPNTALRAVSEALGYGDVTAFHRAFRRWTGESPAAFREHAARTPRRSG